MLKALVLYTLTERKFEPEVTQALDAMSKKRVMLAIAAAVLLVVALLTVPTLLVNFIIQGD